MGAQCAGCKLDNRPDGANTGRRRNSRRPSARRGQSSRRHGSLSSQSSDNSDSLTPADRINPSSALLGHAPPAAFADPAAPPAPSSASSAVDAVTFASTEGVVAGEKEVAQSGMEPIAESGNFPNNPNFPNNTAFATGPWVPGMPGMPLMPGMMASPGATGTTAGTAGATGGATGTTSGAEWMQGVDPRQLQYYQQQLYQMQQMHMQWQWQQQQQWQRRARAKSVQLQPSAAMNAFGAAGASGASGASGAPGATASKAQGAKGKKRRHSLHAHHLVRQKSLQRWSNKSVRNAMFGMEEYMDMMRDIEILEAKDKQQGLTPQEEQRLMQLKISFEQKSHMPDHALDVADEKQAFENAQEVKNELNKLDTLRTDPNGSAANVSGLNASSDTLGVSEDLTQGRSSSVSTDYDSDGSQISGLDEDENDAQNSDDEDAQNAGEGKSPKNEQLGGKEEVLDGQEMRTSSNGGLSKVQDVANENAPLVGGEVMDA